MAAGRSIRKSWGANASGGGGVDDEDVFDRMVVVFIYMLEPRARSTSRKVDFGPTRALPPPMTAPQRSRASASSSAVLKTYLSLSSLTRVPRRLDK